MRVSGSESDRGRARAESSQADVRAYALNTNSKQLLESLRAWPDAHSATPVTHMEVHGDVDGSVHFDALAQGVDARSYDKAYDEAGADFRSKWATMPAAQQQRACADMKKISEQGAAQGKSR